MDTKFWNNLILGRQYEDKVAQWFEQWGLEVWKIGNWKLPIDLVVWSKSPFCVEVKFRSNQRRAKINTKKLDEFLGGVRAFVVTISPDNVDIVEYQRYNLKQEIKEAKEKMVTTNGLRKEALEHYIESLEQMRGILLPSKVWNNREDFLNEILIHQK